MATFPPEAAPAMGEMAAPAKTVCITANPDGSFAVGDHEAYMARQGGGDGMGGMETPEAPGMGAEMAEKPGMTPAASIDEALDMARQMLEGEPSEEMSVEQAFNGGFNGEQPKAGKGMY